MQEQGQLSLDDKVFGPDGILWNIPTPYENENIHNILDITLKHLLTHTSGGWDHHVTDVMF
jgi:CubicO group peptidase (beta-lactamase class C family)